MDFKFIVEGSCFLFLIFYFNPLIMNNNNNNNKNKNKRLEATIYLSWISMDMVTSNRKRRGNWLLLGSD